MEDIFNEAKDRRRNREFILTSRFTNACYYGSPAWARKKEIWPPLSETSSATEFDSELQESARRRISVAAPRISRQIARPPLPSSVEARLEDLASDRTTLYHPLHDGETIRILELRPGKRGDPIACTFRYANLKYLHLQYEALSYVWGRETLGSFDEQTGKWVPRPLTIRCNGHTVEVTPNLYSALEHIRGRAKPLFIWADALCINQQDDRERGHQVTLMDAVYSQSTRIHIWIGEKDQERRKVMWDYEKGTTIGVPDDFNDIRAQRSFGAICDIVNRWQGTGKDVLRATYTAHSAATPDVKQGFATFEELPATAKGYPDQDLIHKALAYHYPTRHNRRRQGGYNYGAMDDDEEPLTPDLGIDSTPDHASDSQFWCSVKDLFDQSWFWRVWVVQEVVLAQSALVRWGNVQIDWRWIGLAAAILRTSYHGICEKMQIGGVYNAYLMFRMSRMSDLPPPRLKFTELLRLTRQFEVTDPRDRVYGLLGMRTEGNDPDSKSPFLPVDYTISEKELWKRLAWKVIQTTGDLSILSSVQHSTGACESEDALGRPRDLQWDLKTTESDGAMPAPSWVPNWECVYRATLLPWDSQDAFAASRAYPLRPMKDVYTTPHVLQVEGIQVGTVGYTGVFMWHDVDTSLLRSRKLGAFFASGSGLRLLSHTYAAGRNAYGSLLGPKDDQPLADLAAHIINLHDRHREWSERKSQMWERLKSGRNARNEVSKDSRQISQTPSRSRSPGIRGHRARDVSRSVSQDSVRNDDLRAKSRSFSTSISPRSSKSVSRSRSRATPPGTSGLFSRFKKFTGELRARSNSSSRGRSGSRSRSTSRSRSRSLPGRSSRSVSRGVGRLPSRGRTRNKSTSPSPESADPPDQEEHFESFTLHERGYVPLPRKDFNPIFKRCPNLREQLQAWAVRGDFSQFLETAMSVCERRRLFVTLNGFLGLGPDTVEEGDILAVLAGGDVPYLLRPIKKDTKLPSVGDVPCDASNRYLLVGECFVQGLMDGEAVDAADRESELLGPVPLDLTHQEIIDHGNQSEKVPDFAFIAEIKRTKRKRARLEQGLLFRTDMLADQARPRLKKEQFHIW